MIAVLADTPPEALMWTVGGVGVAALIGAVVVSVVAGRRRRRRPAGGGGLAPQEAPASGAQALPSRPAPFVAERPDEERGPSEPADAGQGESEPPPTTPPPPPAREWTALWAAPRGDNDAPADAPPSVSPSESQPLSEGEPLVDVDTPEPTEVSIEEPSVIREPATAGHATGTWGGARPAWDVPPSDWPVIPPPPPSAFGSEPAPWSRAAPGTEPFGPSLGAPFGPLGTGAENVNLRGVLRWLLFETDADAIALLQVAPGGEQLFIEPRGLPDHSVADLARRARDAMISGLAGERTTGDVSTARWLGVGGSKLLLLTGASPLAAAEPIRFARFAIDWLAGSRSPDALHAPEETARSMQGVAWAELTEEGSLRVLPSEQGEAVTVESLGRAMPGQPLRWIVGAPVEETRARLVDVHLSEMGDVPSAEVRLLWEGAELKGVGRGHTSLVGRHLAAARAAIDALKPLVHGLMHVEHLQVSTLPSDVEVVLVSVLVGDERMVGATLVRPDDEARAGAKAVLDALNRRLVVLAGQSGQI